ncbi:MAG: 1-acyl-sn-glycerol-3-phosphate acyltransferase [Candidatus Omnitrophica bacterium]|nr:1-acyl-sn-glycerol-3-phosphate acyltransferase [Candidatus Omnitrophota bacterium]
MTYFISRLIIKALLKILLKFEVTGRENLPKKGPFIMASNHASYIDPALVGVACNTAKISFMAKRELFERPFLGAWCKAVGCIPVERKTGAFQPLKEAIGKLVNGASVGIFPEGTRSKTGELQKAESGIGLIAYKAKAPIIPIYISGTEKALPRGQRRLRLCKVKAKIGKAVDISEAVKLSDKRELYAAIGSKVMESIASLKHG